MSFALEESLSFSLDSNLTSENNKNSCNTNASSTTNNNNANNNNQNNSGSTNSNNYFAWNCDKSDLGSIDSSFFKNSLHSSSLLEKSNSFQSDPTKIVSRAEIHNENNFNNNHNLCDESDGIANVGNINGSEDTKTSENHNNNKIINNNHDIESAVNIIEDTESGITIIEIKDKKQLSGPTSSVISYDSIYLSSESDKQTVLGEEETNDNDVLVIDKNDDDDDDENFDDIDLKIKDFENIIRELNLIGDSEKSDTIIDNLYSQVAKGFDLTAVNGETKINADTLSKYTDCISKGTLERLAILSGFSPHNSGGRKIEKDKRKSNGSRQNNKNKNHKGEFQYASLPDVDISKLLRDCELIDANLRDDVSIELLEPFPDYDIDIDLDLELANNNNSNNLDSLDDIVNINNHHNKQQQQLHETEQVEGVKSLESCGEGESIGVKKSTTEPVSLEEENPKGAPSIELVQLHTKELYSAVDGFIHGNDERYNEVIDERLRSTTKIYIADLGLELDYENSIASFEESDEDFETPAAVVVATTKKTSSSAVAEAAQESHQNSFNHYPFYNPPSFNLVTISGRKVIVDELAAKTEQKDPLSSTTSATFNNNKNNNSKENKNNKKPTPQKREIEKPRRVSLAPSSSSGVSSSTAKTSSVDENSSFILNKGKEIKAVEKINGADSRPKANIDKRVERKIKVPECKQAPSVDSATDKEIIARKKSSTDDEYHNHINKNKSSRHSVEIERAQSIAGCDRTKSKDFTSFCGLQKSSQSNQSQQHNKSKKMPRPQLLNIVDSKNSVPKLQIQSSASCNLPNSNKDVRQSTTEIDSDGKQQQASVTAVTLNETEQEFLHKVDSVRNYWSRMLDTEALDMKRSSLKSISKAFAATSKSSNDIPQSIRNEDGFQSFFPTVEIVELNNGETQAALVTARKLNDVEFDHVRYKVMKSEMFQKNIVRSGNNNRKETQFDGLMQYLQDYSFQELLAKNNVVIIEPVRTKIEKISNKPNQAQSAVCKITNGAAGLTRNGSNNLKKHFFYHPIRVNKELYEDELPVPDTVRNVRKLFEESLRLGVRNGAAKLSERDLKMSKSSDNLKPRKTIRYLTIDTSYDNNLATSKWDSISLSSGVSSADLSSPCECASSRNACNSHSSSNGSKENLDNNDDSEKNSFVNTDALEKIRECGSSITYYGSGGAQSQVVLSENEKNNPELMTKVITKDVGVLRGEKCSCHGRLSRYTTSSSASASSNEKHHHHVQQPLPQQLCNKKMNNNDYTGEIITDFKWNE